MHQYHKDSPPHLKYVLTLPCEITTAADFNGMWDIRIHHARYEAAVIAQATILSQESP